MEGFLGTIDGLEALQEVQRVRTELLFQSPVAARPPEIRHVFQELASHGSIMVLFNLRSVTLSVLPAILPFHPPRNYARRNTLLKGNNGYWLVEVR